MFDIMHTPFMHGVLTAIGGYAGFMVLIAGLVILSRKVKNVRKLSKR